MKQVDYVILSKDLMTPTDNSLVNYVLYLKPKYFLIGDDSKERLKIFFDQIKKNGTTIIIQNIKKVNSTTDIINKIKNLK
jgi:bifunctional ADP-heptose synthase (sugar kinase/adenylyltransferase)